MERFEYWTKKEQDFELMCIQCGAIRPTIHLPVRRVDAMTNTLGPLLIHAAHNLERQGLPREKVGQ